MLVNIIAVVFVLGVMIIVHELGHFLAAKYFNVRVEAFSIGFGKRLFGKVYGGTDYKVCALPLGGFVKMAGDNLGEGSGDPGEFLSHPRWHRFFIALMGPVFNFILAVALLTGLFVFHYEKQAYQELPAQIAYVQEDSPAAKVGLQPGDLITRVEGVQNPTWEALRIREVSSGGHPLDIAYRRDGKEYTTQVTPNPVGRDAIGIAGWAPFMPAIVGQVEAGLPAGKAGIQPGDRILSINGKEIKYWPEMTLLVQASKGQPLALVIRRAGKDLPMTMSALHMETPGVGQMWRIGITFHDDAVIRQLSLPDAFKTSLQANRTYATLIFEFVGKLLERKISPRSFEGVIGISKQAGDAARQGWPDMIQLMAMISINLGIFNLFPIPILDGGLILMLFIEGALRRDLSVAMKEKIITVGFVFLVLFTVYVTYMDIVKSLPDRFDKFLP